MTIYDTPSLPPCRVNSIQAEFLDTKLLVFTFPKTLRANTSELINAKTIIIMVILVILIHGLSLTLPVYEFLFIFFSIWINFAFVAE